MASSLSKGGTVEHLRTYRLALMGFGAVGKGLAQILANHGERLQSQYGIILRIVAVATRSHGSWYDPAGLDPHMLLGQFGQPRESESAAHRTWDPYQMIGQVEADVLVELSPTDLVSGEPATSYMRAAFARGMHVVTANKGPIALHFAELRREAIAAGVYLGFEGTVMSGTPALRLGWSDLAGCDLREVRGILNGTTNYILSQMESGWSYHNALAEAQQLGYAEADPAGDVEGHDALAKAVILANVLMGGDLRVEDIKPIGITDITIEMIEAARSSGQRWKLLAHVWRTGEHVQATVRPTLLPNNHPLANVTGVTNAITFTTDLLGDVTLIGPGAGGVATAFAIVSDILAMHLLWKSR